jgi:hypothetical protein
MKKNKEQTFKEYKIRCKDLKQSTEVQLMLYKLGYKWPIPQNNTNFLLLFMNSDGGIYHCGEDMAFFKKQYYKELSIEELEELVDQQESEESEELVDQQESEESEELDLTKILKIGDKVWSPVFGEGKILIIDTFDKFLRVAFFTAQIHLWFYKKGRYSPHYEPNSCVSEEYSLYHSKDQRDWSEFIRCPFERGELIAVSDKKQPNECHIHLRYFQKMYENKYSCMNDNDHSNDILWIYAWKLTDLPIPLKIEL